MALGGYKFAGRKVTKPEGATDVQWVLLCHKCRVKAFLESNALSSAGWAFDPDQSSGQISFETYGNVIYRLDDLGYNLVSFFKHGEGDAYFAICTLTYYAATADLANGRISLALPSVSGTNNYGYGLGCVMFCTISLAPLNTTNYSGGGSGRLGVFPCGRPIEKSNSTYYPSPSNWGTQYQRVYVSYDSFSAGFAIKGSNIITFVNIGSQPVSYANIAVFSVGGFSSMANPNDNYNIFQFNPGNQSQATSVFETENSYEGNASSQRICGTNALWTLNDEGYRYYSTFLRVNLFSMWQGAVQYYPFEAIAVGLKNGLNSVYLNRGKGLVSVDLLAISCPNISTSIPAKNSLAANGNYLAVTGGSISGGSAVKGNLNGDFAAVYCCPCLYIGWDPSNPDITQESAWTAYTE